MFDSGLKLKINFTTLIPPYTLLELFFNKTLGLAAEFELNIVVKDQFLSLIKLFLRKGNFSALKEDFAL